MVGAVEQDRPDINDRETGQDPVFQGLFDSLIDRRDVLTGNAPAGDLVDELVAAAGPGRFQTDDDVPVLALTAGLADVLALDLGNGSLDGLPVGHLRFADVGPHFELAEEAIDFDLEVKLAHAGNDGLAGFLVGSNQESRIFFVEPVERLGQLLLVGLGLGLDGDLDNRGREGHRFELNRMARIGQGVAGGCVLEADPGDDVTGEDRIDVLAMVRMHSQQAAEPLLLAGGGIEDGVALLEAAGVDPEIGELADMGVGHDLEGQGREWLRVRGIALDLDILGAGLETADGL